MPAITGTPIIAAARLIDHSLCKVHKVAVNVESRLYFVENAERHGFKAQYSKQYGYSRERTSLVAEQFIIGRPTSSSSVKLMLSGLSFFLS